MKFIALRGSAIAALATTLILGLATTQLRAEETTIVSPALTAKGLWDAGTTYAKDDIVTTRGSAWISLRDNNLNKVPGQTQPPTVAYWELFARGFNPTGAWSNATKYQPDDLVTQNGQTYRAKITNQNRAPNHVTYWELFAAKGAPGPNTGIGAGSQTTPAISFSGDTNTGIYSPGADKIALVEGGTLFMHNIGSENTALGAAALGSNTSGFENTALGVNALTANTTAQQNTAIGANALAATTSGSENTGIGSDALLNNTTGNNNSAVGVGALLANTTGIRNSALGRLALGANTTGSLNTALGYQSLRNNTADGNTAIGDSALLANVTGTNNTAVGSGALQANTADSNTAIGKDALRFTSTGHTNTAIGFSALSNNTTGGSNTVVGDSSLFSMTFGERNTVVGAQALGGFTSGNDNIAIGYGAGTSLDTTANNTIFIGNFGVSGDTDLIKIGTQGTQQKTFIAGIRGKTTGAADAVNVLIDSNGQLGTVNSSRRYKYDIEAMGNMSAMLGKLRPVTFRYKQAQIDGSHPLQYGLIAEEVADAFPDLAVFKGGRPETVKYHLLPSFLLAGYQAQEKTIAAQAEELRQQKEVNASLEARLLRLEAVLPQAKAAVLR